MPYFPSAQTWLQQSQLLLSARPTTTRITTKYTISPPVTPKPTASTSVPTESTQTTAPKAFLTLKTYDPVSGVCLKYKTDKAAEVGRLVAGLGACSRLMAALPEKVAELEPAEGADGGVAVPDAQSVKPGSKDTKAGLGKGGTAGSSGGGGGGGKKKKGKK